MTPMQLDYIINGAKVYLYRRPDGTAYASVHDYSRFGVNAAKVVRVKLDENSSVESVLNDPEVLGCVEALTALTSAFRGE